MKRLKRISTTKVEKIAPEELPEKCRTCTDPVKYKGKLLCLGYETNLPEGLKVCEDYDTMARKNSTL